MRERSAIKRQKKKQSLWPLRRAQKSDHKTSKPYPTCGFVYHVFCSAELVVLISAVRGSQFRHILKCEHIVWDVICLCIRMCLIQFENKPGKWACLFQESVLVFPHHVTLLLTDMWQQPHANPRPDWNHMTAHTSTVYTKWATWIIGFVPSSINNVNKNKATWLWPSFVFISISVSLSNSGHRWC